MSAKLKTEKILGAVQWQSETHGLCRCPGEDSHTTNTRGRDTTVFIDGVPTIFCWHTSCQLERDRANRALREAILDDGEAVRPASDKKLEIQRDPEAELCHRIGIVAKSNRDRYLEAYAWNPADMFEQSPQKGDCPTDQYRMMLSLFAPDDTLWIGQVTDSGKPSNRSNFRKVSEWMELDSPVGQFTSPSVYPAGCTSRSNENATRRYFVVESDTLSKEQMGAVLRLMRDLFQMKLHAIVDTGGRSIHGWFETPPRAEWERQLKAFLVPMGCDPATFKASQPVRMPGAKRDKAMQSLLWFCKEGK